MGGFDDHVAIMGDWMPPSPNPGAFFMSMINDDVAARPSVESDSGNISVPHFPGPEREGASRNADQKDQNEANFGDNETSNSDALGEPKLSSRGGLMERIAARAGFNAPRLNTESIRPADLSKKPEVRSPYLTIPPGLSPTTLLDSPVFLSNSLVLPSPTTGKFSFAPIGDYRDSTLMACDSDKGKENNFEDINASSFAFKPITESASFPYFAATNKSFPSAGFTVHSNTSLPRQNIEPTKTHLAHNSTLFQEASFSKTDLGNNGSNNLLQQTHNSVGAPEHSSPFDEQNDDGDQRSSGDPNSGGSTAEDGYNWRKYGQKHVKGSEYPRSYYKCTHPSCPVKKKVERSQEGHITEIIYKGAHIHPKPPPNRRSTLGSSNAIGDIQLESEQPTSGDPMWSAAQNGNLEVTTSALPVQEYSNTGGTALQAQNGNPFESGDGVDASSTFSNDEDDEDRATHGSVSLGYDGEGDESESKRRRIKAYAPEMSGAARPIREPRVVVQTTSEVDILDDGYRWRKYGQKVVKGNPNPRSYYKCTSAGCNVRKHVERASHDLKSVITTYEGKHNHDVPAVRNSGAHANSGGQNALPPQQQAPAASSNVHRPEPSQIRGSTTWFERPLLGSFGLPPGRPQLGPGPGFGYGMNQRGLAGLGFAGIGHNQGKLAALPNHLYLGHRGHPVNDMGYMMKVAAFLVILLMGFFFIGLNARRLSSTPENSNNGAEVRTLLAFKQSSIQTDPKGFIKNWSLSSSSPCSWGGVLCSDNGSVSSLAFTNAGLTGRLHISDLTPLTSLTTIRFSGNFFDGNLSSSAKYCSFESLDLSLNSFSEPLAADSLLISCTKLAYLNLSHNSISTASLKFGPSLSKLDLSGNKISDLGVLTSLLSNCQNLNLLNLSSNKLGGKLESSLPSCKSLEVFDLSNNHLQGEIPFPFIKNSVSLKNLGLSRNNFTSNLMSLDLGSCKTLTSLDLSHNSVSATGFPPSLAYCQSLETLDFSHNLIKLVIPGDLIRKMMNLKQLVLASNEFFGEIPAELGEICGKLEELDLSGNQLTGELPSSFISCSSLISLKLGNNQLSGRFLDTVVSSITSLKYLYAPFNNISGLVPRSLTNCSQLRVLDLSSNDFTGNVPSDFCYIDSVLEKLLLANNYLSGAVPPELGLCKNLRSIDLSFNDLSGSLPAEIWALPALSDVVMWANNLSGEIPQGICINGGNLQTLILNNNFITGTLPKSIVNCTNLIWVSLSSNRLSGEIPSDIGNLVNLAILQLGNNSLTGAIPPGIGECRSLIWLDLNSNELTGPLPPEMAAQTGLIVPGVVSGKQFAFVRNEGGTQCRGAGGLVEFEGVRADRLANFPMVHSCPSTRIYSGLTVYTFTGNGSMIYLDLSYNRLSGAIPGSLGSMSYLQVLNLGHNALTGEIPFSFGGLKSAGVLDLSHNDLEGTIPGSLGGLSFLSDLDVSNNNLSGTIPSGGQLTTFPSVRYENNSGLCGVPLPPCGSSNGRRASHSSTRGKQQSMAVGMVIGIMASVTCICLLLYTLYRAKRSQKAEEKREKYMDSLPTSGSSSWKLSSVHEPLSINVATFEKPLRKLTFAHLLEATNGFSADSLIGSGGFGDVYKAQLRDGSVVAIKKLIHVTGQGDREFMAEMETIGKIKHRNLVPLLGYCRIGEERLLVYEYMKWGSLEAVLHDRQKIGGASLDWGARKRIAIGSARGLAFLHHSCIPHIIHRDMKSSNVLLDENFEARVSDFGMARLVNALDTHLSVSTLAGTPGYVPPEYYQSFRCTAKGDVYSYGVVLLELLSGKRPIDTREFGDDNNLVGWAKQLHRAKKSHEILDPQLITTLSGDAELYHYLRIAFECLDDKPYRRPTMIQVMAKFKELQADSESDILDGMSLKNSVIDESQEREP